MPVTRLRSLLLHPNERERSHSSGGKLGMQVQLGEGQQRLVIVYISLDNVYDGTSRPSRKKIILSLLKFSETYLEKECRGSVERMRRKLRGLGKKLS